MAQPHYEVSVKSKWLLPLEVRERFSALDIGIDGADTCLHVLHFTGCRKLGGGDTPGINIHCSSDIAIVIFHGDRCNGERNHLLCAGFINHRHAGTVPTLSTLRIGLIF